MPIRRRKRTVEEDDPNSGPVTVVRREDKKDGRYEYKLAKIDQKTDRALAVAAKRNSLANLIKWILIAVGVVYGIFQLGSFGGVLEIIKGFGT